MSLRNAFVASALLIAASASLVGAQTPPCAISGLTFCYPVSDHNDIGIADSVFSGLDSIVAYTAGEYDGDTNLDVEATNHNIGKDYKIIAYKKKRGNYKALGWVEISGEEWWGNKRCAYMKFKLNGIGEAHITCPQGETIYSAKIFLNGPLIASTALGKGITEDELTKHVMMHEFYHAVGFIGHPTSCTRSQSHSVGAMFWISTPNTPNGIG